MNTVHLPLVDFIDRVEGNKINHGYSVFTGLAGYTREDKIFERLIIRKFCRPILGIAVQIFAFDRRFVFHENQFLSPPLWRIFLLIRPIGGTVRSTVLVISWNWKEAREFLIIGKFLFLIFKSICVCDVMAWFVERNDKELIFLDNVALLLEQSWKRMSYKTIKYFCG